MLEKFNNKNFRFAVECLIKYNGKYLICKRRDDCVVAPSIWNIPGGKVKINESFDAAVMREVFEEINMNVLNPNLMMYHYIRKDTHQRIVATYICELNNLEGFKVCMDEFSTYSWIDCDNVNENCSLPQHLKSIIAEDTKDNSISNRLK